MRHDFKSNKNVTYRYKKFFKQNIFWQGLPHFSCGSRINLRIRTGICMTGFLSAFFYPQNGRAGIWDEIADDKHLVCRRSLVNEARKYKGKDSRGHVFQEIKLQQDYTVVLK